MKCTRVICFILLYLLSTNSNKLSAQGKLSEQWIPNPADTSYENIINHLEKDYQLSFSYSPNILNQNLVFPVSGSSSIKELFDLIFIKYDIEYDLLDQTRVLLYRKKSNKISISGVIRDYDSKESIPAASIFIKESGEYIVATDEGYFYLEADDFDKLTLTFNSVSYSKKVLVKSKSENKLVVELESDIETTIPIIIPTKIINNDFILNTTLKGISPLGLSEITEQIKNNPMVQNGSEGQTGFVVKGGSPDQNLILLDGMPVYNVSHIGGLSSIFVSSAVKEVKLHTAGISAEYGGKLSSVMDVKINEGNTEEFHGNFTTGITGAEAHIEGPLVKNKTAISLSGRYSWLNVLSNSFFKNFGGYDESDLNYYDVYAKLHHKFSPTNRLSLSYYKGNDQLYLFSRDVVLTTEGSLLNTAEHDFNWGNEILSLQWNRLLSKTISMSSTVGFSSYSLRGSGEYYSETEANDRVSVNIDAISKITDIVASTKFDIYNTSIGKVIFGANVIFHSFTPELLETVIVNEVVSLPFKDDSPKSEALEINSFVENEIELTENVSFRGGLHLSSFSDQDTTYYILEPRANLSWQKNKHIVDLNLSLNHQYIHLLTNPGTGLPSDLWVPSSTTIAPSKSQELSISYKYNISENWSFESHGYVKLLTNIKSYKATSDVVFKLLGEDIELGNLVTSERDWRDRVDQGRGFSTGLGGLIKYNSEKLNFLVSYSYNYTSELFPFQSEYFFSRFHRPNDILAQASYVLSENWSVTGKFVFGSGIRYTFADEFIPGPPQVYTASGRNLQTLDPFHHLDFNLKYKKSYKKELLELNVGVYNIYNRENIFFTYLNLDDQLVAKEIKIGLIPLLPNVSLSISF